MVEIKILINKKKLKDRKSRELKMKLKRKKEELLEKIS